MSAAQEALPAIRGSRDATVRRFALTDAIFHALTRAAAILVLVLLGGVAISLFAGSWPALSTFGFSFLTSESWNPVTEKFGALAPIYGTIVTSVIAILIAVPISFGIAIFLTELCPRPLRRPIGIAVELLAGIPSIIYGLWGFFLLAPFLQTTVQPSHYRPLPWRAGLIKPVCRPALRHRPADFGAHPRHHGAALHHLDHQGRLPHRADGAAGIGLRHRLHDLGSDTPRRHSLYPHRHHRRHHARLLAARSAKPWR